MKNARELPEKSKGEPSIFAISGIFGRTGRRVVWKDFRKMTGGTACKWSDIVYVFDRVISASKPLSLYMVRVLKAKMYLSGQRVGGRCPRVLRKNAYREGAIAWNLSRTSSASPLLLIFHPLTPFSLSALRTRSAASTAWLPVVGRVGSSRSGRHSSSLLRNSL